MKITLLLFMIVFVLGGPANGADSYYANYLDVIDGDTVCAYIYDDPSLCATVRVGAIDAPELDQPFGLEAKQCLVEAVSEFSEFYIEAVSVGKYGRIIGIVTTPGNYDLGYTMVTWGCAWYYDKYAHQYTIRFNSNYRGAEMKARINRDGLWQQINPTPPWLWR